MHVAFVVPNYPPHSGGVQKHVQSLAHELVQHESVTVFALENEGRRDDLGVPVVGLGRHAAIGDILAFPSPTAALRLAADLRTRGVTHVSVHTRFFPATWLGIMAARTAGIPCVLTEHGGGPVRTGSAAMGLAARAVDKTLGRWAWRSADGLLAVSDRAADFVLRSSGKRARVCGNGIDARFWTPSGPVQDGRRLVYVGRLVEEKGWRTFLEVAGKVPGDVAVTVLGDGPDLAAMRAEVARRGMSHRVRMLGHAESEAVRAQLRGAVLVNPSLASEGLQTTLLEGVAAGARVVTYDVGGAAECARMSPSTWVVPVGDTEALLDRVALALDRQWAEPTGLDQFSWQRVAAAYLEAFERASTTRKPRT